MICPHVVVLNHEGVVVINCCGHVGEKYKKRH